MISTCRHHAARWLAAAGVALLVASGARAEEPAPAARPDPTAEQRQKMAESHRQMADCLASEAPIAECRTQMHARCTEIMGEGGCMGPGMGMRHGKGRRGMGGGMQPPAASDKSQ